jgi:hypothetical protein
MAAVFASGALLMLLAGPARSARSSSVSSPSVDNISPSAAAGARTTYVVTFTTSRNGPLNSSVGTNINLVFPAGTGLGSVSASSVDDTSAGANGIGSCQPPNGQTITCTLAVGAAIPAGDAVRVTLEGVRNPSTPSGSLSVSISTATDMNAVKSAPYSVLSASKVSQPSVNNSSPSAVVGAQTAYVVTFTTSRTGGLSGAAGGGITLVFPSGTGLGSVSSSTVDDVTTKGDGIGSCGPPNGQTISCSLLKGAAISGGDAVRVTVNGVTNPSTASSSLTMSVFTTSDTTPVTSAPYAVLLPPPVPAKSVDVTPASGVILVKRPGQNTFIRLTAGQQIPLGSQVNATNGVVSLTAATNRYGHKATARAYGGVFIVRQRRAGSTLLTVLRLSGPKPTGCAARAARAARPRRHRALIVRDPGDFLTIGLFAWGRGQVVGKTTWLTKDTCAGTLMKVIRGTVRVHDRPHHHSFLLHAGHSFLSHPGKGG